MYTTIEADLINGKIEGVEVEKLPSRAHVLVTLLSTPETKRPLFGTTTSEKIKMDEDVFEPLADDELTHWGLA